jgi:hypothetical protein
MSLSFFISHIHPFRLYAFCYIMVSTNNNVKLTMTFKVVQGNISSVSCNFFVSFTRVVAWSKRFSKRRNSVPPWKVSIQRLWCYPLWMPPMKSFYRENTQRGCSCTHLRGRWGYNPIQQYNRYNTTLLKRRISIKYQHLFALLAA